MNEELFANICDAVTLTALSVGLVYSVVTRRRREKQPRPEGGFSLLELMVTVAIIAILSMIAIPRYRSFTAESRRAEARVNLRGIHTYQEAYMVANNVYWNPKSTEGMAQGVKYGYDTGTTWKCAAANEPKDGTIQIGAKAATKRKLGWKFKSKEACEESRYGYTVSGTEGDYVALAHGGHDKANWIYEQCNNNGGAVTGVSTSNCSTTPTGATAATLTGYAKGDSICIGADKPLQIIADIIEACK